MKKIGNFFYEKSSRKDKKLMVRVEGKLIHFGNPKYGHFKDKTGIWKNLDHNDNKRKNNYLSRSGGIKNKSGQLTKNIITSPNYHARKILW